MKKKNIVFIVAIILSVLIAVITLFFRYQNEKSQTILNLSMDQKLSDFDELCDILSNSYPFWNEVKQAGIDRDTVYSTYRNRIQKTRTDIEYFKEISYFLKEFKGLGHLVVLDGSMYRLYLNTLTASQGMLTEGQTQSVEPLVAALTNPTAQNTYSLLDQSHRGFRSTIGLKEEYKNTETADQAEKTSALTTSIFEDKKAAYLKIQSFELTNYEKDKDVLTKFFVEIKDIPNLIIDLRGNSGGSDLYWKDLLIQPNTKESLSSDRYYVFNQTETTLPYVSAIGRSVDIIDTEKEPILSQYADSFSHFIKDTTAFEPAANSYKGKIWILVDEDVYSASENFVIFCKNTGFATLVGTATGGDGGIADPILVTLPNSGLIVRYSMFYGLNADGSGNEAIGTVPDVVISENENALDKCLSLLDH